MCVNLLLDLADDLVRFAKNCHLFSINFPCRFPVLLELIIPYDGELDFWLVHRSSSYMRRNLFSVEKTNCLTDSLFSQDLR